MGSRRWKLTTNDALNGGRFRYASYSSRLAADIRLFDFVSGHFACEADGSRVSC